MAQALRIDIHDGFLLARFAPNGDFLTARIRQQSKHFLSLTDRTQQVSILCPHFTTLVFVLQYFCTSFLFNSHKINITSSQKLTQGYLQLYLLVTYTQ